MSDTSLQFSDVPGMPQEDVSGDATVGTTGSNPGATISSDDVYRFRRGNVGAYNKVVVRGGRQIQQTVNQFDEVLLETDIGPADSPDEVKPPSAEEIAAQAAQAAQQASLAQSRSDAFSRLRGLLSRFGLSDLEGAVKDIITSGAVDLQDANAIIFSIRGQPAYQRRFAANAARVKNGLPELDPATYIGLEESYRQLLQANGLPAGFYDQLTDFKGFIEGDVSPAELQERVEQGYRRVRDADPEVKRQMLELYNVDEQSLVAHFLDPERARPLLTASMLTRQAQAAQIAARGKEQANLQLSAASAEDLAARGITPEEAQQAFAQRGQLQGLYQSMAGEQTLTEEQALGATFGYNTEALSTLDRRRRQRLAEFQGGGGFARTTGATSGTVETGAGTAQ